MIHRISQDSNTNVSNALEKAVFHVAKPEYENIPLARAVSPAHNENTANTHILTNHGLFGKSGKLDSYITNEQTSIVIQNLKCN